MYRGGKTADKELPFWAARGKRDPMNDEGNDREKRSLNHAMKQNAYYPDQIRLQNRPVRPAPSMIDPFWAARGKKSIPNSSFD